MKREPYKIEPWKKYRLADNGVYAPRGSNPTFHTELTVFDHLCNPIHPEVVGYIMHDQMKGSDLVPKSRIFIHGIIDDLTPKTNT